MTPLKSLILICTLITGTLSVKGQNADTLLQYYQTQRYAEALQYLQGYTDDQNTDPKLLGQLGYLNMMTGRLPEAEKIYLKLYEADTNSLPVLFNLASLQQKRGQQANATHYYKAIVALDSNNLTAYKQLATLSKGSDPKEYQFNLIKANSLNPIDPDVAYDLGELYINLGDYKKANAVLTPALQADTANLQLLKLKMFMNLANKKYEEAIKTGEKLLSFGDSSSFVMNNLGKSHFLTLDYKNALKYFLQVKDKAMENEGLFYNIALSYRGLKDYKNASIYLDKTLKEAISDKTATYYGLLGDSYERTKKYQEALAAYKRGLLFENNGSLYYNIALVYENGLQDKKNAIANYNLYLKHFTEMNKNPKLAAFIKNKIEELKR
ncbi:tetratricopeptide repeat protein [Pedobacter sp.]|uniref:tetratricopeptide repeat protein n=1 Tax=Pedobacter sp. TaxID=1411316 RepID=UPI003D7F7662